MMTSWRAFLKKIDWNLLKEKFLRFNLHAFPHLYITANVLLAIELVTYRGFTARYVFVDSRLMLLAAVCSCLLIFWYNLKGNRRAPSATKSAQTALPPVTQLTFEVNKLAILPLFLINNLLISLDFAYYPNYVYSHFHINPDNFHLVLTFNVFIVILQLFKQSTVVANFIWKRMKWSSAVNIFFLLSVLAFVVPNVELISHWSYDGWIKIIQTRNLTWNERLIFLSGGEKSTGWIVDYTRFINKVVAPRGVIFIPPQKESWQMEGNPYFMRWFIYPRFTVQDPDQKIEGPIPPEAEYVLIDQGAWPGMTEYGWPRMFIPADQIEKIFLIDRQTRVETTLTGQDYDPKILSHKWGVIQLKKNRVASGSGTVSESK